MVTKKYNFIYNKENQFHMFAFVNAGSIYEPERVRGISHLLEHMLLKRTQKYSEKDLTQALTLLGGNYNAMTDRDATIYFITTHIDNYKNTIQLMQSIIREPKFNASELDLERKVVFEEIKKREDEGTTLENLNILSILDGENKYALPIEGSYSTLLNVDVGTLKEYFERRYKDVMFFINCDERYKNDVQKHIYKAFGKANPDLQFDNISELYNNKLNQFNNNIYVLKKDYNQYTTHIAFPAFPRNMVRENAILNFIQFCLVSSGLYSILMYQLRIKRGLVYSISSMNQNYRYVGFFRMNVGTSDGDTPHILSLICDILSYMKKKGIPKGLLEYFKKSYLNNQKFALTNEHYRSIWYGENAFYGVSMSEKEMLSLVEGVSNKDVIEIASKVFDFSSMGVVTYGKYKSVGQTRNKLIEIIDSYESISPKK